MKIQDTVVLITGAAMGMGRIYAQLAAREGAGTIVLWDINAGLLEQAATELKAAGARRVIQQVVDVSSVEEIKKAAASVLAEAGPPHLLINNAGIARGKYFWEHAHDLDIELIMRINALAPMHITRAFLPAMLESPDDRRIVNIASAGGLVSNPRMSVYSSSKWAVVGWSDSLRLELEKTGNGRIKTTTVCPNYISTGMFKGVGKILLTRLLTPEEVTNTVWTAMKAGKPYVIMPWTTQLGKALKGVLPVRAWDFLADRVFGIYNTMDSFVGRKEPQMPTAVSGQRDKAQR